jgi:hypothetical protein
MRCVRALILAAGVAGLSVAAAPADDTPTAKQKLKQELRKKLKAKKAKAEADDATTATPAPKPKPTPRPTRVADASELAALVDKHLDAKLTEAKVSPAPQSSDAEFLRRAYLDLTGVIPPADETRRFLDDKDPAKRARLIDGLLASEGYGRRLADVWKALLIPTDSDTRFISRQPFDTWLVEGFNGNKPWDRFARELVTAAGSQDDNPAVTFFLTNRSVDKLTDAVTQHLLGVQLACAQCHNHPFTDWKQDEYWGVAAFFSKVQPDRVGNPLKKDGDRSPGVRELATKSRAKEFFPEGAKAVPAKFLGGDQPKLKPADPYRPAFADWMTAADNPFFARAMVNRTWYHLFGRGLVNPVDDMHEDNEPSHPELLDELAKEFAAGGFDLKQLIRGIANSRAYQRTSKPAPGTDDPKLFARQAVKVMGPEMLFDSLTRATGLSLDAAKGKQEGKAVNLPKGVQFSPRDRFVTFYLAGADAANPTEYDAGIPQALKLMNSRPLTGGPGAAIRYVKPAEPVAKNVEALYLATLSRRPTAAEVDRFKPLLAKGQPAERYGDLLWALLNSSEFSTIR